MGLKSLFNPFEGDSADRALWCSAPSEVIEETEPVDDFLNVLTAIGSGTGFLGVCADEVVAYAED